MAIDYTGHFVNEMSATSSTQPIQPGNVFKDNLAQLPAIDGIERIDLVNG